MSALCHTAIIGARYPRKVEARHRSERQTDAARELMQPEPSDQDLIVRVREARDQEAMAALYDRYGRSVYALALSMLREPRAAEDVAQDVFVTFWQRPERYVAARGTFGPWILRVTRNRTIDVIRRRGREQYTDDEREPELAERLADPDPDLHDQVWSRMMAREVRGALRELTDIQRQVIELAYFGGMSQSEMADHLQVPLGTIKTRVRTALHRLAQVMAVETWTDAR